MVVLTFRSEKGIRSAFVTGVISMAPEGRARPKLLALTRDGLRSPSSDPESECCDVGTDPADLLADCRDRGDLLRDATKFRLDTHIRITGRDRVPIERLFSVLEGIFR